MAFTLSRIIFKHVSKSIDFLVMLLVYRNVHFLIENGRKEKEKTNVKMNGLHYRSFVRSIDVLCANKHDTHRRRRPFFSFQFSSFSSSVSLPQHFDRIWNATLNQNNSSLSLFRDERLVITFQDRQEFPSPVVIDKWMRK